MGSGDPEKGGSTQTSSTRTPSTAATESTPLVKQQEATSRCQLLKRVFGLWTFLVLVLAGGCWLGVQAEGWHPITALYVVVQIATTVGYGDFTVHTSFMKVVMSIYVIVCLVIVAYGMNLGTQSLLNSQTKFFRKKLRQFESRVHRNNTDTAAQVHFGKVYSDMNQLVAGTILFAVAVGAGTAFYALYEACTCSYGASFVEGCVETPYDQCVATGGYVKNWGNSFYMSVITMTTVGFGDHTPRSKVGRGFACVWMIVGCACTANWLAQLTKVMFEMEKGQENAEMAENEAVSADIFHAMDKDGNGVLSMAEFRGYMLVKHGMVTQEALDLLDEQFQRLDTKKTGSLTLEECLQKHLQT